MCKILSSWWCLCCSKTMAIKNVLPWILSVVIIILTFLVLVLLPIVQCSGSTRIYTTNMAGSKPIATNIEVARFRNEAAFVGTVEVSTRKVPTGPDPLHHNNSPLGP